MKKHFAVSMYSSGKGRFVTIFEDITTRKLVERALRESEEKFRGIFDMINDGIHIHEIEPDGKPGKFVEVNEVACRMLQYTREELLESGPLDFVSGYIHAIARDCQRVINYRPIDIRNRTSEKRWDNCSGRDQCPCFLP